MKISLIEIMLIVLFYLCFLVFKVHSEVARDAYHGVPRTREAFTLDDITYYFYAESVSWEEAKSICKASQMNLASLDTPEKAKFVSQSIAVSWMVFEDMWIGGMQYKSGEWIWVGLNKKIPLTPYFAYSLNFMYPPWFNPLPASVNKACLSIDRNMHDFPYFVDLNCKLPRQFICEENQKGKEDYFGASQSVSSMNREYTVYHTRKSWTEAVSFCRDKASCLASIKDLNTAKSLAKIMIKSRPEFEDAWIGASYLDGQWTWVENGEELVVVPPVLINPNQTEVPDNIKIPRFPQWLNEDFDESKKWCTLFDRHAFDEPKFIATDCEIERDVICMSGSDNLKRESDLQINYSGNLYTFSLQKATWTEAVSACNRSNSTLVTLRNMEQINFILSQMSETVHPMDHIWLGGKLVNGEWIWIKNNSKIPRDKDNDGFPPWCTDDASPNAPCLNMDRQNHFVPLIYGLECNASQYFVCMQEIKNTDNTIIQERLLSYLTISNASAVVTPQEAASSCRHEIGYQWNVPFNHADNKKLLNDFAKQFANLMGHTITDTNFIVAGKYDIQKLSWKMRKGDVESYAKIATTNTPQHGDCLLGKVTLKNEWIWNPVKCYSSIQNAQFVCESSCSPHMIPYNAPNNSEWLCTSGYSKYFNRILLGTECDHQCPPNKVLVGPNSFYCTNNGWYSGKLETCPKHSTCENIGSALHVFNKLNRTKVVTFIIDSTTTLSNDYAASKYVIAKILEVLWNNNNNTLTANIVSMETELIAPLGSEKNIQNKLLNYIVKNECNVTRDKLIGIETKSFGKPDYNVTIVNILKLFKENNYEKEENVVVFLLPQRNRGGSFEKASEELQNKSLIFAIRTNSYVPTKQILTLASTWENKTLAYSFNTHMDLLTSITNLDAVCTKCKCTNIFKDLLSVNHITLTTTTTSTTTPRPTPPPFRNLAKKRTSGRGRPK